MSSHRERPYALTITLALVTALATAPAPASAAPAPMIITVKPGQTINTATPESYRDRDVVYTWTVVGGRRGVQEPRTRCSIFHYARGTVTRLVSAGCDEGRRVAGPIAVRVTNTSSDTKTVRVYRREG